MSEPLTLYKLIILYMLDQISFPLSNAQISNFILDKDYTTYFTLQQAISELIEADLISTEQLHRSSQYRITPKGQETLSFFGHKISQGIIDDIHHFLRENQYELREQVSVTAQYYKTTLDEYAVRCRVKEKHSDLVDLTLTVPDEEQAIKIAENWQKKSQEIYSFIITRLM